MHKEFITQNPQETIQVAVDLSKNLKQGDVLLLKGDLGSGKTTFVKGLAKGLKAKPKDVNSPTFVLMNVYKGKFPIYHFDLYRLEKPQEIQSLNIDEYLQADGLAIIEWPERLGIAMPEAYAIEFKHKGENQRQICIFSPSKLQPKTSR